jgi:hypothetical protein
MMWGMVYGATALSSTALRLVARLPVLPLTGRSIVMGLLGAVIVWFGRYAFFERLTAAVVGLRFVTVIGLAIVAVPKIPEMLKGMALSCTKVASSASWALACVTPLQGTQSRFGGKPTALSLGLAVDQPHRP